MIGTLPAMLRKMADIIESRKEQHGAYDVFTRIGELSGLTAAQVADVLCAVKIARLESNPSNADSLLDAMNYTLMGFMHRHRALVEANLMAVDYTKDVYDK